MAIAQGHGWADGDFGRLRASNTDRERAVDVLKAAFAEGRLTKDEYDDRIANVFASRTYADLAALTSDLPAGPLGTMSSSDAPMYVARRGRNAIAVASLVLGLAQPFTLAIDGDPRHRLRLRRAAADPPDRRVGYGHGNHRIGFRLARRGVLDFARDHRHRCPRRSGPPFSLTLKMRSAGRAAADPGHRGWSGSVSAVWVRRPGCLLVRWGQGQRRGGGRE